MTDKGNILAIDDTPESLKLLSEILRSEGYDVRSAPNGELALHAAASNPPELVLLDIRMPGMDGYEVCRRLKEMPGTRTVPVIFVSAASESAEKVRGFELGAVDFVTKPYQRDELLARVDSHLRLSRLSNHLEEMVEQRTAELREGERKLRASLLESITALASMVEIRDPYTFGHQNQVAQLAEAIARELDFSPEQIEGIHLASVVHDVGKIKIPAEILTKPGRLSALEFNLIKEHSRAGYDILKNIEFPWKIAEFVLQHHERLDGSGYPDGIAGERIHPESRIIAVADVVESMISSRPYRPGLGVEAALQEIERGKGKLYDAAAVDACIRLFRERGFRFYPAVAAEAMAAGSPSAC